MRYLIMSTSLTGGAGGAALRLYRGLQAAGVDAHVLERRDTLGASGSHGLGQFGLRGLGNALFPKLDRQLLKPYRPRQFFAAQWAPDGTPSVVAGIRPDIINLHWVCNGFVRVETLARYRRPLIWTLHDMWPFTGGCFYSGDCRRFETGCGSCPQLERAGPRDLSRQVMRRKQRAWRNLNLTIVSPSRWLAELARRSALFGDRRIEVIPNGIDLDRFRPLDRQQARSLLRLPAGKKLLLFGAWRNEPRKGFHLLLEALQRLDRARWDGALELVVFGFSRPRDEPDMPFPTHFLGRLNDALTLALAYSAADIFVAPSQVDNLPTTVMESLACGTPVAAFDMGGNPDLIDHLETGFLAPPFDTAELARGIVRFLDQAEAPQALRTRLRARAEQAFPVRLQVERYRELARELLQTTGR